MTWPKGEPIHDRAVAEALDRYWDSLGATPRPKGTRHPGGYAESEALLDPGLTRTVRALQFADKTPRPDPAFAARLRADLSGAEPAPARWPLAETEPSLGIGRGLVWPQHRFLVELTVAAALLVGILGGGVALRLPVGLAPVVAPTAASAGEPNTDPLRGRPVCHLTVTPEPTLTATATQPVATMPAAPAVDRGPGGTC